MEILKGVRKIIENQIFQSALVLVSKKVNIFFFLFFVSGKFDDPQKSI